MELSDLTSNFAGLMPYAFDYVVKNGGIDTDEDYGYWSMDLVCQTTKQDRRHVVAIDGYEEVPANDSTALKKAVANQPVSVAICSSITLQFYSSGIVDEQSCCSGINHGVLVVGYAEKDVENAGYWKIKNSWGSGMCVCVVGCGVAGGWCGGGVVLDGEAREDGREDGREAERWDAADARCIADAMGMGDGKRTWRRGS